MDYEPRAPPPPTQSERYDLRRTAARLSSSYSSATRIIGGYRAAIVEPALQRLAILRVLARIVRVLARIVRVLARIVRDLAERCVETTMSDDTLASCG
jgi:hypothetical protein